MYKFNAKTGSFYPYDLIEDYKKSGSWPDDGVDVGASVYGEFLGTPPAGMQIGSSEEGMPAWIPVQPSKYHSWDGESWSITTQDAALLKLEAQAASKAQAEGEVAARKDVALAKIKMLEVTLKHFPDDEAAKSALEGWELYLIKLDRYKFSTKSTLPVEPK